MNLRNERYVLSMNYYELVSKKLYDLLESAEEGQILLGRFQEASNSGPLAYEADTLTSKLPRPVYLFGVMR